MHHLLAFVALTPEWLHQFGAQVIVIAGVVYAVLQALKQFTFPNLGPKWIMLMNVLFSAAGVLIVTPTDQFWTVATLTKLISACAAAAGIHGTVRSLVMGGDTTPTKKALEKQYPLIESQERPTMNGGPKAMIALLCLGLALFGMSGCAMHKPVTALPAGAVDRIDANANQQIASVAKFSEPISKDIKSGDYANPPQELRDALNKLNRALNSARDAEVAYHKAGGGSAAALNAALAAMLAEWSRTTFTMTAGVSDAVPTPAVQTTPVR